MIRARVADTCSGATPCAWRCFGVRRGEAKEAVGKRFIHPIVGKSKWNDGAEKMYVVEQRRVGTIEVVGHKKKVRTTDVWNTGGRGGAKEGVEQREGNKGTEESV